MEPSLENGPMVMKIYLGEQDRCGHRPLYEVLLELLLAEGVAGATVQRGICGFGSSHRLHAQKILDLSADLPLVIEAVDSGARLLALRPRLAEQMTGGTITIGRLDSACFPGRPDSAGSGL
jgi:PII-like signaling protein